MLFFEVKKLAHFSKWDESCVCNLSIMRLWEEELCNNITVPCVRQMTNTRKYLKVATPKRRALLPALMSNVKT